MSGKLIALFKSWWVFLFVAVMMLVYVHGMHLKNVQQEELAARKAALEKEKMVALRQQEELLLRIKSQDDPQWVELVLMKELGLVPEGHVKVYFKNP